MLSFSFSDPADLKRLSTLLQWLAIGLVFLGGVLQLLRFVVDQREKTLSVGLAQQKELAQMQREAALREELQQSLTEATQARARIEEFEKKQRPRKITADMRAAFVDATRAGPFGPVVLATRTAFPNKEQEDFTRQLRGMLDEAGFGHSSSDIVNGFSTGVDPGEYLSFVSNGGSPPPYFSNLASGLYKIGLISPDVPVAVNNPRVKEGTLYVFIPEK